MSLDPFIQSLIAAHENGGTFDPGAGPVPQSLDDAYQVHDALMAALGPSGAFKTSRAAGEAAILAPIRADRCLPSGTRVTGPATMGIELEVGFLISSPLPAPGTPEFRREMIAALRPLPVIELVATRLTGPLANDPMLKLADQQINYGLVYGTPLATWDGSDFCTPQIGMRSGEQQIALGVAQVPGGSALDAVAALIDTCAARGIALPVGHIVITGSLHPLTYVTGAQQVVGEIVGLGKVSVDL